MILTPADLWLTWAQVEASFSEYPSLAFAIWRKAQLPVPEGAAESIQIDHMEALLTATAAALNLPVQDVYPNRQRIRWLQFCDTPGAYKIFARLDDGEPAELTQPNQNQKV